MVEWSARRLGDREVRGSNLGPEESFFLPGEKDENRSIALSQNGWIDARAQPKVQDQLCGSDDDVIKNTN